MQSLTPRERALRAFSHQEPDRVPVFEIDVNSPILAAALGRDTWVGTGGYAMVAKCAEYLSSGRRDEYVEGLANDTIDMARVFEWDIVPASYCPTENPPIPNQVGERAWRYEHAENGVWYVMTYAPESDVAGQLDHSFCHDRIDGLKRYVLWREAQSVTPDEGALEVTRRVVEACKAERMVFAGWYDVPGAIDQAWMSLYFEWLLAEPEWMSRYLKVETDFLLAQIRRAAEIGVDGIIAGTDLAGRSGPFISPRLYRQMILPHFKRIVDHCHSVGLRVLKHTDGYLWPLERELLVESGIDAIHSIDPTAGMDLGRMKERHGHHLVLCGNVDVSRILPFGTPEEIRREVRRCLRQGAPGGGFVLASSNSLHSQVPLENYLVMLDEAHRSGVYPIDLSPEDE